MNAIRLIFLLVVSALAALSGNADPVRPNILYLYVDDMGWGALGPNGQFERKAKGLPHLVTPNLDRLAVEGINFTRSYGCTVCSPARSSQQTGFHQGHTFGDRNDPDNAKKAIRTDDLTMGDVLSEAGYVTGYWGKWGYGGSAEKTPNPQILNVQTLPTSHGYQHVVAELHHVRAHTFFQPTLWKAPALPGTRGGLELIPNSMAKYAQNRLYPETPALQSHSDYPEIAYCDDVYAFSALDFVRIQGQNYNATGQPFFGLLAVQVPHAPFHEIAQLPEWDKAYRKQPWFNSLSDEAKQWASMITRIDGHFGNILAALEDPNGDGDSSDSIADKTLVVFQSDNGGPGGASHKEFASNAILSGQKGRIQEGGIRVPTLMRLPKAFSSGSKLKPGTSTNRVLDVTDLLPTFSELAGVDVPLGIDGVSIAPTLTGKGMQREREFIIHEAGNGQSIIRGDHKLVRSKTGLALYNLKNDPGETNDISSKHSSFVNELEIVLLDERVAEPKGFANTYHRWIGQHEAEASIAYNWSDYVYENEGIEYLGDDGPPQRSWIARMENASPIFNYAVASSDLQFLAFEIEGIVGQQALHLREGVNLTGRNQIRVLNNSAISISGGKLSSLRMVEIANGGIIAGRGIVGSSLLNSGELSINGPTHIEGDYIESKEAMLSMSLKSELRIEGIAKLAGTLNSYVNMGEIAENQNVILRASSIKGRFTNENNLFVDEQGKSFKINYSPTTVTLIAE